MRFKKTIALILAIIMLVSVTVISASAAYTRSDGQGNVWEWTDEGWVLIKEGPYGNTSTETPTTETEDTACPLFTSGSEGSAESTGIIGGVIKTAESDPLTSDTNVGDYLYYKSTNANTYNSDVKWTLSNGVLVLSGNGGTARFVASGSNVSPFYNNANIKTVIVEAGVTYLGSSVFSDLPNLETAIIMDASTETDNAFRNCPKLKNIIVGANLKNGTHHTDSQYYMVGVTANILVLTKNYSFTTILENAVLRNDSTSLPSAWKAEYNNMSIVSYAELINMAKTALADVPASVLAKLPTELHDSTSQTTTTEPQFGDVSPDAYYAASVAWAVQKGITNGTTATTFSPDNTCTTAQILTFLYRAYGSPTVTIGNPFTDVSANDYYYNAALWAYSKGMVAGGTLNGSTPCTRASTVLYMWQAAGSPAISALSSFTDVSTSANYAQAVAWAVEQGITNGTSATTFGPDATCTRGQIATFLYRGLA